MTTDNSGVYIYKRWCHHQKRLPMFCRTCVNYPILPQVILTLTRPACLMGFACWDFLTSLMLWAWRHQLPPASDLILTTHNNRAVYILSGKDYQSFPPWHRMLISHGPGACHGSWTSRVTRLSWTWQYCHNMTSWWHQTAGTSQCFGETEENCKPVITDC